jgi:hypothetical protein
VAFYFRIQWLFSPDYAIFRGAVFGQRKYYQEENSRLINIYDSKLGSPGTQLMRLRILGRLASLASDASYEGTSFEGIASDLHKLGIAQEAAELAFKQLFDSRLVQTVDRNAVHIGSSVFPTRLGGYLINDLCSKFMYFEPCLLDSSIYLDEHWQGLKAITSEIESAPWRTRIDLRIKRAEAFLQYLKGLEEKWRTDCSRHRLDEIWSEPMFSRIEAELRMDFDGVRRSADRGVQRASSRSISDSGREGER